METHEHEIDLLIQQGESLVLEFKSDLKCLSDRDLIATVVSLANTDGGNLLLGVEDDGTISGLHANHLNTSGIPSLIANKTNPAIAVRVERCDVRGKLLARIAVPKSRQLVSTSDGLLVRRRLKLDGTPEAVPFYPHEFIQRQSSMGLVDPSAMVLEDVESGQLDPLQRLRIRNAIKKYGGEQSLLALADDELEGALGLVKSISGKQYPTVAGLLLLVAAPHSRNPLLADAIKRIGLAERTGRGIDRIYEGMLRYGRPEPDYGLSSPYLVNLFMANVAADRKFLKMVVEQNERLGEPLVEPLIVLARLRDERRLTTSELAPSLQKSEPQTRIILEKLLETGLIEAHGTGRGRSYMLSAKVYRRSGQQAAYVRQAGFDTIQQEQMVVKFIQAHGRIKRADVIELCHLDRHQAYRLLNRMKGSGQIKQIGEQKGAVYELD